jgi:hypothetical protein
MVEVVAELPYPGVPESERCNHLGQVLTGNRAVR